VQINRLAARKQAAQYGLGALGSNGDPQGLIHRIENRIGAYAAWPPPLGGLRLFLGDASRSTKRGAVFPVNHQLNALRAVGLTRAI
jgi:hypothetical protein